MEQREIIPLIEDTVTYVGREGGSLDKNSYLNNPRLVTHTIKHPSLSDNHVRFRLFRDINGNKWVRVVDTSSRYGTCIHSTPINGGALVPLNCDILSLANLKIRFEERPGPDMPFEDRLNVMDLSTVINTSRGPQSFFHSLQLQFEPGKIYALLGPSGCGKTTLLEILAGYRKPLEGDISIENMSIYKNLELYRDCIGYAPQIAGNTLGIPPELTPRAVLYYAHDFRYAANREHREEMVEDILAVIGLGDCAETPIANLSGGQKNRINLGKELISRPQYLFLDEPTSGLSSSDALRLVQELLTIAQIKRISIIISAHQPTKELYSLFDHVVFFAPTGHVIYQGDPLMGNRHWENVLNRIAIKGDQEPDGERFFSYLNHLMHKKHLVVPYYYSRDGVKRIGKIFGFTNPSDLGLGIIALGDELSRAEGSHVGRHAKIYWKWLSEFFFQEYSDIGRRNTGTSKVLSFREPEVLTQTKVPFRILLHREMMLNFRFRPREILWAALSALIISVVISYVYLCRDYVQPVEAVMRVRGTLALSSLAAFWFGITLSARSLIHDQPILKREILSGYRITLTSVLTSKGIALVLIGALQISILIIIVYTGTDFFFGRSFSSNTAPRFLSADEIYDTPLRKNGDFTVEPAPSDIAGCKQVSMVVGSMDARKAEHWRAGSMFKVVISDIPGIMTVYFILILTCAVGIGQGLLISAFFMDFRQVFPREREAILLTPVALIPQILFGGIARRFQDLPYDFLHYIMPERWAYELLLIISSLVRPIGGFLPPDRPAPLLFTINTDLNNIQSSLDLFRYSHLFPAIGTLLLWIGACYLGALLLLKYRFYQFQKPPTKETNNADHTR